MAVFQSSLERVKAKFKVTSKGNIVAEDVGLRWVAQQFAKLFDRVRFPPTSPEFFPQWRAELMRTKFNPIYEAPRKLEFLARHVVMHLESQIWWRDKEILNLKTRIKDLQIENSKLKRQPS